MDWPLIVAAYLASAAVCVWLGWRMGSSTLAGVRAERDMYLQMLEAGDGERKRRPGTPTSTGPPARLSNARMFSSRRWRNDPHSS